MVPKFKAWNGYKKIMADYVSAIQNGDTKGTPSSVNVIVNGKNETWNVKNDHVKLLQFTGMKDAHENEIYEGNLVLLTPTIPLYTISFDKGEYRATNKYEFIAYSLNNINKDCKVVGNMYTNPELLEKSVNNGAKIDGISKV